MSRQLIYLALLVGLSLAGCADATRYDTGAVVLDVSDPEAFNARPETTEYFVSAYDAMKVEDYARAEASLDKALAKKPRDPYSLLAMGAVHERTGRFYSATDYYRSAARYGDAPAGAHLRSGNEIPGTPAQTVADVARANLERLKK